MSRLVAAVTCLAGALVVTSSGGAKLIVGVNDSAGYEASVPFFFMPTTQTEGLTVNALTLRWDDSQPTTIDPVQEAAIASVIQSAASAGVTIELDLYPLHSQALTDASPCPPSTDPLACGDSARIAQFAAWTALVARTFPTVHQFIVMNECNQPLFVNPQWDSSGANQSAEICGRALAAAYDALHAVSRANFVWGVGLSPRGNDNPNAASNSSTSPVRFLADLGAWFKSFALKTHRTAPLMDGFDFHPYPIPQSLPFVQGYADVNDASVSNLPRIYQAFYTGFAGSPQKTIGQQAGGGLPVSLNEMGIQTAETGVAGYTGVEVSANAAGGVIGSTATQAYQATYYQQTLNLLACDPNVRLINIFHLVDEPGLEGWQSGLYEVGTGTPEPKLSATIVQQWIASTGGNCQAALRPWTPAGVASAATPVGGPATAPKPLIVVGAAPGQPNAVKIYDGSTLRLLATATPYPPSFAGGVNVAAGDLRGNGSTEVVTGAGPGSLPQVTILDAATGHKIASYLAFPSSFRGGVTVAVGHLNGQAEADVIVGQASDGSQVKVFSGETKKLRETLSAFPAGFTDGVSVALEDSQGNANAELVVGQAGGGSQVKLLDLATGKVIRTWSPFGHTFTGGVSVATGDTNANGKAEVIVGQAGGGSQVKLLDGTTGKILSTWSPFGRGFTGGVSLAAGNLSASGKPEVVAAPASLGSQAKILDGTTGALLKSLHPFPLPGHGGARVAAA